MEETLVYLAYKYKGDYGKVLNAIKTKESVDIDEKQRYLSQIKCKYTTILSDDYPEMLKTIPAPPIVLFYYGNLSLLDKNCIAVIGKRQCSCYGINVCNTLIKDLSKHAVIVSGLAKGIDGYAHKAAIDGNGKTVAILGSGIDYIYPYCNKLIYNVLKENHLIMSEYPGNVKPQKHYFPTRNRIIAGLSKKILIVEAEKRSGTMITVSYALDQGKDILAIPSRIDDPIGCNYLIQMGAKLILTLEDILEELN